MDPTLVFGAITGLERQRRKGAGAPRRPSPWRRSAASTLQRLAIRLDPPA